MFWQNFSCLAVSIDLLHKKKLRLLAGSTLIMEKEMIAQWIFLGESAIIKK
nr:MAG TPA: hypothetical protein [Caudoviricetes sp.]